MPSNAAIDDRNILPRAPHAASDSPTCPPARRASVPCDLLHRCVVVRDDDAWRFLLARYGTVLRRLMARRLRLAGVSSPLAERIDDLMQDFACRLIAVDPQCIARFHAPTRRDTRCYLLKTAHSVVSDHLRRRRVRQRAAYGHRRLRPCSIDGLLPCHHPRDRRPDPEVHALLLETSRRTRRVLAGYARQRLRDPRNRALLIDALLGPWSVPQLAAQRGVSRGGLYGVVRRFYRWSAAHDAARGRDPAPASGDCAAATLADHAPHLHRSALSPSRHPAGLSRSPSASRRDRRCAAPGRPPDRRRQRA
ncbi:MAG: hypothetical protein AAF772_14850 [Acidobacteriota bacterium]